jgi:hypothetical protein
MKRLVHSEPTERQAANDKVLEPLYDLMGCVLAKALDEFDDKLAERDAAIAELKARIAERDEKHEDKLIELRALHLKQIKRLTARLTDMERKHAREIAELKPASEIIGYGTSKTDYRIVPFQSNGRPGASINLRPLFERYHQETQQ